MDNPVINFLTTVCDIVILHFLWLITSIPILTIGASTTALYYTTMKCIRSGEGMVVKRFFKSFRENTRQSTKLWLIMLLAGAICGFDLYYSIKHSMQFLMVVFTIMTCAYIFIALYVFPLQAQFENTIKATLKNAMLLSLKNFPWTLLLIAFTAVLAFMSYRSIIVLGAMIFVGAGFYAYICSYIYVHVFREYLPEEEEKNDEDFHMNFSDYETDDCNEDEDSTKE